MALTACVNLTMPQKDGSIPVFAQIYAELYRAYLLEEASYHNFDCGYE